MCIRLRCSKSVLILISITLLVGEVIAAPSSVPDSDKKISKEHVKKVNPSSPPPSTTTAEPFETAHKVLSNPIVHGDSIQLFHTAHKIPLVTPIISESVLKSKKFSSTQTKPTLDPVLSELIQEDVQKNIEARKRHIAAVESLTTEQPILDVAASEKKQTSRIQIKKGPNGQDYEYEYVYYYDDDEEDEPTDTKSSETTKKANTSTRATTALPLSQKTSKKSAEPIIPVNENGLDEPIPERLPQNTRFPPRHQGGESSTTHSPSTSSKNAVVKRPSLELVDSHSFNTGEKSSKGPREREEQPSTASSSTTAKQPTTEPTVSEEASSEEVDKLTTLSEETKTTIIPGEMDKIAYDLYAILTNENLSMDSLDATTITTLDAETTTSTEEDGVTETESIPSSTTLVTTTTTTTTEAPTTTTTTTTTVAPPLSGGRRRITLNKNRFNHREYSKPSTEAPQPAQEEVQSSTVATSSFKNRFSRPKGGYGGPKSRTRPTASTTEASAVEESIPDEPKSSVLPIRSRTRNRFNLRTTTTATSPAAEEEIKSEEAPAPVSTSRLTRPRGSLNVGSRSRFGGRSTTTTTTSPDAAKDENQEAAVTPSDESASTTRGRPTPRRFNLGNRFNRLQSAKKPAAEDGDQAASDGETRTNEEAVSSTTQSGINRLRQRPNRLQINERSSSTTSAPVRRINPLLARRRPGLAATTLSTTIADGEEESSPQDSAETDKGSTSGSESGEEALEAAENTESEPEPEKETTPSTTAAPLRGLALLQARRRQPLKKSPE